MKIKTTPLPEMQNFAAPASVDWRDNGGNFVSGVRDQKKCGSCWAFAMTAGLESNAMMARSRGGDIDLSEQVMVSCSGVGSCNGGTLDADFLVKTGLPPEKYYPYGAVDGDCSQAEAGWEKVATKIGSFASVAQKAASIKNALAKYGPLPTAMWVYEDFMHYKSGVYSYVSGKKLGGHAILIVGYSEDDQAFIVKNSWGPKWGEGGFFKVAYSELTSKTSFGMMTIAYRQPNGDSYFRSAKDDLPDVPKKIEPLLEQRP